MVENYDIEGLICGIFDERELQKERQDQNKKNGYITIMIIVNMRHGEVACLGLSLF